MTDDPKLVAAFVEATPEMDELERKLATALINHMDLGPIIHLALLSRMVGVVIASSTMELTDGVMTASTNIFHGYNLKMTEEMPTDPKDLN